MLTAATMVNRVNEVKVRGEKVERSGLEDWKGEWEWWRVELALNIQTASIVFAKSKPRPHARRWSTSKNAPPTSKVAPPSSLSSPLNPGGKRHRESRRK